MAMAITIIIMETTTTLQMMPTTIPPTPRRSAVNGCASTPREHAYIVAEHTPAATTNDHVPAVSSAEWNVSIRRNRCHEGVQRRRRSRPRNKNDIKANTLAIMTVLPWTVMTTTVAMMMMVMVMVINHGQLQPPLPPLARLDATSTLAHCRQQQRQQGPNHANAVTKPPRTTNMPHSAVVPWAAAIGKHCST